MFKDRYNFQNNQPLINFMIYDFRFQLHGELPSASYKFASYFPAQADILIQLLSLSFYLLSPRTDTRSPR